MVKHNGRIYLAKDARVSKKVFEAGYPKIKDFRMFRKKTGMNKKFNSLRCHYVLKFDNQTVLIIGGNSEVGKSLAKNFAMLGANLILTCRKYNQLKLYCNDIQIRYSTKL